MLNIRTIKNLKDNDGLTLKNGVKITYKTGWQVATIGVAVDTPEKAMKAIKDFKGNCGVWFSGGLYYIDFSFRVNTKKEAMRIGREWKQISILCWRNMKLAYC